MKDDNIYFDEQNFKQQPMPNEPQAEPIDLPETTSSTPLIPQPQNEPFNSNADIDKKIRFWRRFSFALGLIIFFG